MTDNIIYVDTQEVDSFVSRLKSVKQRVDMLDEQLRKTEHDLVRGNSSEDYLKNLNTFSKTHIILGQYNYLLDENINYLKSVSKQFELAESTLTYKPKEDAFSKAFFESIYNFDSPVLKLTNICKSLNDYKVNDLKGSIVFGKSVYELIDSSASLIAKVSKNAVELNPFIALAFNGAESVYENFFEEESEWGRAVLETTIETTFEFGVKKALGVGLGVLLGAAFGPVGFAIGRAIGPAISEVIYQLIDIGYQYCFAEMSGNSQEKLSEQISDYILGEDDEQEAEDKKGE